MEKQLISTAQEIHIREHGMEGVKIVSADASEDGVTYTLGREYMKPVKEYIESTGANGDGVVFLCPEQNKPQAAFLASQAYLVMAKEESIPEDSDQEEEIEILMEDLDFGDFFAAYEEDDGTQQSDPQRDLMVIDYGALFEKKEEPNEEMVMNQRMQQFQKISGSFQNVLLLCPGNTDVDHLLYIYRTIAVEHKAICFYGQLDDFLLKRVTFELQTRPEQLLRLKSPTSQEYVVMLQQFLQENGYPEAKITEPLLRMIMNYRKNLFTEQDIYNHVGKVLERKRNTNSKNLMLSDFAFTYTGKKEKPAVEELEELIGLDVVKDQVKRTVISQLISQRSGVPVYGHMIFSGRPGTAKTTCARLYNNILAELFLSNGRFIEAGRADLIGDYMGQTAPKVKQLFEQAEGGMIFIDEAGFLGKSQGREDAYVQEAVIELVRNLENNPQTRVILATYPEYAKEVLEADPGLASRLKVLQFPSYSEEELLQILYKMMEDRGAEIRESQKNEVENVVISYLQPMMDRKDFGNGREVRKLLETALEEYGMELFYGKNEKSLLPDELEVGRRHSDKKKIILTAKHFEKAATHIKNTIESLEEKEGNPRKIGFVLPVREGMRGC